MIGAAEELAPVIGTGAACVTTGVCRATLYRHRRPKAPSTPRSKRRSPRQLSDSEQDKVRQVANSEQFRDQAPASIVATLLDEGKYLCSIRTMYRILGEDGQVGDRRNQLTHPHYAKPELLATGPNQCWSWDITKLRGPVKWSYFYLYVIIDIFSRYVPGWMVANREDAELAKQLVKEAVRKQGNPKSLVVHTDRGSSMTSKSLALLLADLGITKSHSRPHVSDDNPYSEAAFKTLKYRPGFPARFGSIEDARAFSREFFTWYNGSHRHSGIALMTPEVVHYGKAEQIQQVRAETLLAAYRSHPERFPNGAPKPWPLPTAAWINRPTIQNDTEGG